MANVLFKRGLQNNLPSSTNIQDGAFYLTTDTNRLYVGQEDKTTHDRSLKLLNQTVQFASSINALSNGDSTYGHKGSNNWTVQEKQDHINDFFYVIDGNILATWDGTQWVQINKQNPEIYVTTSEIKTSTTNNVATVEQSLSQFNLTDTVDCSFGIEGGTNISVSTSGTNVIVNGAEYSIARAEANNNASKVTLSNNLNSSSSSFAIVGGNNVTVSTTGTGDIIIAATNTVVTSAELSLDDGDIKLEINDNTAGGPIEAALEDIGIVLDNGQWVKLGSTTAGTAGAIYSKDQVDTLINGINGMTIMGTIDTNPVNNATITSLSGLSNVRVGDTYIATGEGMRATALGGSIVAGPVSNLSDNGPGTRVGDMFIAKSSATPNPEVGGYIPSDSVQWYYIPAGNDSADAYTYNTTVTTSNNAIMVESRANTKLFGVQLSAGDGIAISSSTGANSDVELISTISHATYATTSTTATAASHASFSAITSITATNGHITGYSVETFSPTVYQFTDSRATAALCINGSVSNGTRMSTTANAGINDITFASNLADNVSSDTVSSNVFKITSDTIKLSAGNPGEIVMNMEWGEF